jgi:hypothetical protein
LDSATHRAASPNRFADKALSALNPALGSLRPQHLARRIAELVDEHLDLGPIRADGHGDSPDESQRMVGILL